MVDDSAAALRNIERSLHDGTQARLVTLAMNAGLAKEKLGEGADPSTAAPLLDRVHVLAKESIAEIRDLARGIHPAGLDAGLDTALRTLAAHITVPVRIDTAIEARPTPAIEKIAYLCAAELLTNAVRHSGAVDIAIDARTGKGRLRLVVSDDGRGGAQSGRGSLVRITIAEDSAILRDGRVHLLTDRGHHVIAAVPDGDQLHSAVMSDMPEVCVIDIRMPPSFTDEGLRTALALRNTHPGIGVLIFSQYIETRYATDLVAGSTRGVDYLLKDRIADVREFSETLERVAAGGTALDPEVVAQLLRSSRRTDQLSALTPRERQVLAVMAEGLSNAGIATALTITARAVEKHVASILTKLDLPSAESGNRRVLAVLRYLEIRPDDPGGSATGPTDVA